MIKVAFLGNSRISDEIKNILKEYVVQTTMSKADFFIVSADSVGDLYSQPRQFDKPALLYLKTNDPNVSAIIKNYNFSGILTPSFSKENLIKKILSFRDVPENRNLNESEILKSKILAKAENIPPLPAIAQELLRLTRNDETPLKKIIEKIKMDQGIAAKILRLVNSPFYALRKDISSIDQASILIGTSSIKNIVLSISTEEFYKKDFSHYRTTGFELWNHANNTAVLAEFIGKKCGFDPDACYLAGLMHDVGKIVLVDFLVKEVNNYNDEKRMLGMTHQEIASVILKKWGIKKEIINAVLTHHTLTDNNFEKVLFYSNKLAYKMNDEALIQTIESALKTDLKELHHIIEDSQHG